MGVPYSIGQNVHAPSGIWAPAKTFFGRRITTLLYPVRSEHGAKSVVLFDAVLGRGVAASPPFTPIGYGDSFPGGTHGIAMGIESNLTLTLLNNPAPLDVEWTILALFRTTSVDPGGFGVNIFTVNYSGGGDAIQIQSPSDHTTNLKFTLRNRSNFGGGDFVSTAVPSLSVATWCPFMWSHPASGTGVAGTFYTPLTTTSIATSSSTPFGSITTSTLGFNQYFRTGLFAVVDGALPAAAFSAFVANPWQLFAPRNRLFASAALAPTLSAATAFNIAATTAQPRVTLTF